MITQLQVAAYSGRTELANSRLSPGRARWEPLSTGAGAGTHQVYVQGRVFLAGPYKGAPLSILAVVPAVSGPYDLGNIVVRSAINLDEETAQVHATTDPIPQIIEGVPLRTRHIRVSLNRPNFTLNPTNCDPFAVNATLFGERRRRRWRRAPSSRRLTAPP